MLTSLRIGAITLLCGLLAAGCASGGDDTDVDSESDAIIGGETSWYYPAVGVSVNGNMTGCSATLVASNVILTAAHGFPPDRTDVAPWQFEIRKSATKVYRYPTGRGYVMSRGGAGEDDLALLRLETAVPPSVAKPLALAEAYPDVGTTMRMIGFGCTARDNQVGAGTKRRVSFKWGDPSRDASCPGDSGGALVAYPSGQVVGVISGWQNPSGDDIYAWVPKHYATLREEIAKLH